MKKLLTTVAAATLLLSTTAAYARAPDEGLRPYELLSCQGLTDMAADPSSADIADRDTMWTIGLVQGLVFAHTGREIPAEVIAVKLHFECRAHPDALLADAAYAIATRGKS